MFDRDERIDRHISAITFHSDVPDDVVQRFEDVKVILDKARERKRLIRAANEYALATVELALRIMCDRLGLDGALARDGNYGMGNLMEWLYSRKMMPPRPKEHSLDYRRGNEPPDGLPKSYDALRRLRNSWVHPRDDSWLGWNFLNTVRRSAVFVDQLYDEPLRRRERRHERVEVNRHCARLCENGIAVQTPGRRFLARRVNMLYCNISTSPTTYYFALWPLCKSKRGGQEIKIPRPYLAKGQDWQCTMNGSLRFETQQGNTITLDRDLTASETTEWGARPSKTTLTQVGDFYFRAGNLRRYLLELEGPYAIQKEQLRWIE